MGREAARKASLQLIQEKGVDWIISAGVCGGLREGFSVGDIVQIGSVIEESGKRWSALPVLTSGYQHGQPAGDAGIHFDVTAFCSGKILTSSREKEELGRRWEAGVVDMESAGVAEAAAETGTRFSCVRGLSDAVGDSLPMDFSPFVDGQGRLRMGLLLLSIARRPWVIPGLVRLGARTSAASKQLANCLTDSLQSCRWDTAGAKP